MVKVVEVARDIIFAFALIAVWGVLSMFIINSINGTNYGFSRPYNIPHYLFFGCLIAPIVEELVYRYAPITIGRKFDLVLPVVCLASVLFGWAHGFGHQSVFVQGGYGFIFSWVYLQAKRLPYLVTVVAHSMWNLMFVFLPR